MNIEQRFLIKALEDRNFICFNYENKSFKDVKVLRFEGGIIHTDCGIFKFDKIKKIVVLKNKF